MKHYYFLSLYLFICLIRTVYGLDKQDIKNEHQAAAFYAARDYNKADKIYDELLLKDMPEWEKLRIFYNKGVIKLAEHKWKDAFSFFKMIPFDQVRSPLFFEKLMISLGFIYYLESTHGNIEDSEREILLLASYQFFKFASEISCSTQQIVNEKECLNSFEIDFFVQLITMKEIELQQNQLHTLLGVDEVKNSLIILQIGLQRLINFIHLFQLSERHASIEASYRLLLNKDTESLLSLWKTFQEKSTDLIDQINVKKTWKLINQLLN